MGVDAVTYKSQGHIDPYLPPHFIICDHNPAVWTVQVTRWLVQLVVDFCTCPRLNGRGDRLKCCVFAIGNFWDSLQESMASCTECM